MKKIIAICILTALCLTMLVGCDMQGGLIAELFGQKDEDYYDVPPVPGDDVILIEPDIAYTEIWTEGIWTEDWTEEIEYTTPSQDPPEFMGMAIYEVAIVDAIGSYVPLRTAEQLGDWNGTLELESLILSEREASLQIYGFMTYNQSDAMMYDCSMPGGTVQRINLEQEYVDLAWLVAEQCGASYVHGFFLSIPIKELAVGYNAVDLYGYATELGTADAHVIERIDILLAVPEETESDEADTAYPVPPEEMTEAPTEG